MTKSPAVAAAKAVEQSEVEMAEALAPVIRNPVVKAIGAASEIGDQPPLYALSAGVIVAGLAMDDPRTLRAGARMLAAHVLAIAIKNVMKRLVDRTRPRIAAEEGRYERGKGEWFESDYNSFPSGHTASSLAVARALGREFPEQHGSAQVLASAIAVTQVVRGNHYLTDVIAGAAIGIAAEAAVDYGFRRFHPDVA